MIVVILVTVGGLTYAFFNYTKTGDSNIIRVGNVEFTSNYTGVTLQNIFPIDSNDVLTDNEITSIMNSLK